MPFYRIIIIIIYLWDYAGFHKITKIITFKALYMRIRIRYFSPPLLKIILPPRKYRCLRNICYCSELGKNEKIFRTKTIKKILINPV